jgi:hypothetical protein
MITLQKTITAECLSYPNVAFFVPDDQESCEVLCALSNLGIISLCAGNDTYSLKSAEKANQWLNSFSA